MQNKTDFLAAFLRKGGLKPDVIAAIVEADELSEEQIAHLNLASNKLISVTAAPHSPDVRKVVLAEALNGAEADIASFLSQPEYSNFVNDDVLAVMKGKGRIQDKVKDALRGIIENAPKGKGKGNEELEAVIKKLQAEKVELAQAAEKQINEFKRNQEVAQIRAYVSEKLSGLDGINDLTRKGFDSILFGSYYPTMGENGIELRQKDKPDSPVIEGNEIVDFEKLFESSFADFKPKNNGRQIAATPVIVGGGNNPAPKGKETNPHIDANRNMWTKPK